MQMHWHAGNALAQTVLTCRYVHHLRALEPQNISPSVLDVHHFNTFESAEREHNRREKPVELLTIVLRAGVMGMLKCCDLAYRELVKGCVHDVGVFAPVVS
jgi:N-alpha-acetyltransferase 35, NatC auxiliary subunit